MELKPAGHDILMRLLDATTQRRDVQASNVASLNVPGYRRREVSFEEHLAQAIRDGVPEQELLEIQPRVEVDWDTQPRADGNNVDPEREAGLLKENRIRFELYAAILRGRTNLVQQAILSDR